ncbi:MAG: outer membrane protein [Legionella sp.]
MNKYAPLILASLLIPLHCNAAWYGGINLGINAVTVDKELLYPLDSVTPTSSHYNNSYTNFHGQLAAGYEMSFNDKFRAALEANADIFTGSAEHSINNWFFSEQVVAKEQLEYGFSLFLLPAYQLNPNTRVFIGPGLSGSQFKISSKNTAGNVGVTGDFDDWLVGGSFKAGIATQLTQSTELVLSYQYTAYQDAKWTNMEPTTGELLQGSYKPSVNSVMLGIRVVMPEYKGTVKEQIIREIK